MNYLNNSPVVLWFVPQFDSFGIMYEDDDINNNNQNFLFLNNNTEEINNLYNMPASLFTTETKMTRKSSVLELALLFQ